MSYFATAYTIHFDDTMAYGSHHFLTSFKFQCASREALLFGEQVFDALGVKSALDGVHLLTADAYSRNLNPAQLGERVAILLTLEDWQRASARFCYRVINAQGEPICAGFQTLLCADAATGMTCPLPPALRDALDELRCITEPDANKSFRERVLAGGSGTQSLFSKQQRETAQQFLTERYPHPRVVAAVKQATADTNGKLPVTTISAPDVSETVEAWVFAGQGAFNAELLSKRITAFLQTAPEARSELERSAAVAHELLGGDTHSVLSGSHEKCAAAVTATPELIQVAIHVQNVLGARLLHSRGRTPAFVTGHSFGEVAAFAIAGCFDLPTGVEVVCHRVRAISQHAPPGGGLLAVSANRALVTTEAALNNLCQLVVAGRNHSLQTVVSGPLEELEQFREALQRLGIASIAVATPTSFHHPRLRPAATVWLQELNKLSLKPPALPLFSPNGRRFITADDDIAATLASQLLKPFDLQGGISDLIDEGVTLFMDCGSSGSLEKTIAMSVPEGIEVHRAGTFNDGSEATRATTDSQHRNNQQAGPSDHVNGHPRPLAVGEAKHSPVPEVAIVGEGCILPAGAHSPEALFSAIMEQRSGIVDQRDFDSHWTEDFYSEKLVRDRSTTHLAGRVENRDIATPPGIDPHVFAEFSRTQKLLSIALAPCVDALKNAQRVLCLVGATADGFEDHDLAVSLRYAGVDASGLTVDERLNLARSANQEPHDAVQEVFDVMFRPGLEVVLVDAACASSLYTVALGMRALQTGEADAVIAGGVFCPGPGNSCLFSQFRGTTATGLRPFDASADGVVFSEGAAVIALRRLADAEQLELPISAVIKGFGLSSDGRSSSANVPQTHGQILSLQRCYANFQIDPASIVAVEAHGTSTPVGDSTELETLRQFYSEHVRSPLHVHSLKGLLGHAGWAAGTASIIAVCEYLRNGRFPAQAGLRNPSKRLTECQPTLNVPSEVQTLSPESRRVAIDGFGFGGANAHVVLESFSRLDPLPRPTRPPVQKSEKEDELVFVAVHELSPTLTHAHGRQFDRAEIGFPQGHVLLPDLADDMDISQKLTMSLVDGIIAQLPGFDDENRQETGIVLALSGKTERGVEATMRVLTDRLRRQFAGVDEVSAAVDAAHDAARPSGPYTLQCMMPNVAPGRAALQFNLNGPNFVVDAGNRSLEAAVSAASLLLNAGEQSGTKVVITAAIHASPWQVPSQNHAQADDEFAAAFAVTTRGYAEQQKLNILSDVRSAIENAVRVNTGTSSKPTTGRKVRALVSQLRAPKNAMENVPVDAPSENGSDSNFPIHVPVWVETPVASDQPDLPSGPGASVLLIVSVEANQVTEIVKAMPAWASDYRLILVGSSPRDVVAEMNDPRVIVANLHDQRSVDSALAQLGDFEADMAVAVEKIETWDQQGTLSQLATDNSLCEMLFLVAQKYADRLGRGQLDLYGLVVDGWSDMVHPASGPFAGLLKSIRREMTQSRVATVCTRGYSLGEAIASLQAERNAPDKEAEVVFDGPRRLVRRLRKSLSAEQCSAPLALDSNSVVIATGGARGVTGVLTDALLRDYGCTVVALGRSELESGPDDLDAPQVEADYYARFLRENPGTPAVNMKQQFERARARWEAHRTMEQLSSAGGQVDYLVADLTDHDQVASAMEKIVDKYGRVDLIVHGAGVQISKRLTDRTLQDFRRTFSVKVAGLNYLMEQCRARLNQEVPAHVLTSAYSVFGNDGQHDYGAANETLDRLCQLSSKSNGPSWSSIAWLAWDGIGMTRGSEYHALSKQRQLSTLTARDGQHIFRQVVAGRTQCEINVPLSESEHVRYQVPTIPASASLASERILENRVDLSRISCLPYHKVRGVPTLPGAWILDQMVVAGLKLCQHPGQIISVTVQDALFHRFVKQNARDPNLRIVAETSGERIKVWMIGDLLHASGTLLSKDILFAEATLSFHRDEMAMPSTLPKNFRHNGHHGQQRLIDPYCHGTHNDVELSGPFDCVRDIVIETTGRFARFVPGPSDLVTQGIPGLVLDAALRVGAMYAGSESELYVPLRIGRLIAPVGAHALAFSTSPRDIRTTVPFVENGHVRWERTEALDDRGAPHLILDDALATRLR